MTRTRPTPLQRPEDLTLDARNANRGTPRGQRLLTDSLTAYGAGRSVLADRVGRVIAGNKTVARAQALGLPIRVVPTDGRVLVVVQRTDLDLQTDPRARRWRSPTTGSRNWICPGTRRSWRRCGRTGCRSRAGGPSRSGPS